MKTKLFAFLLLFFAVSLVAWSYTPGDAVEEPSQRVQTQFFEVPSCAGRDRGSASTGSGPMTSHPVKKSVLTPSENPLNTAFIELNCLLASN